MTPSRFTEVDSDLLKMRQMKLVLCTQKLRFLDGLRKKLADENTLELCFESLWGVRTDTEITQIFHRHSTEVETNPHTPTATVESPFPRTIYWEDET